MRKKRFDLQCALLAACAAVVTMSLAGSTSADDVIWTNDFTDRLWSNVGNWDQFEGNCGPDVTPDTVPVAEQGVVIIETEGDPIRCSGTGNDRPEGPPAGQGPIVDASATNAGGYYLIADNNLDVNTGGSLRFRARCWIGSGSGKTGVVNIDGGEAVFNDNQYVSDKDLYIGLDGGTGTLNVYAGEARVPDRRIYVGSGAGSSGTVTISGGRLQSGMELRVGNDSGSGVVNQTGGLIEVTNIGLNMISCYNGAINLNGGECYSRDVPVFQYPTGKMFIDGGMLRVNDFSTHESEIRDQITFGNIVGANSSTDPDDGNWKIALVPPEASKYTFYTITVQSPIPPCEINAIPYKDQSLMLSTTGTDNIVYTVTNEGVSNVNYTVTKVDENGDPAVYDWITPSPGSGSVAGSTDGKSGGTDDVTVTIDPAAGSLGIGSYTAYLAFTPNCDPTAKRIRRIDLEVVECHTDVDPNATASLGIRSNTADLYIYGDCWEAGPQTYTFTVTNTVGASRTYDVAETDAGGTPLPNPGYTWLSLDKTAGGPIASGSSDTVTMTVNISLPDDTREYAYLTFTPNCGDPIIRKIQATNTNIGDAWGIKGVYKGDVHPMDAGSCTEANGHDCNFVASYGIVGGAHQWYGTVVTDPDAENQKAFLIDQGTLGNSGAQNGFDMVVRAGYLSSVKNSVSGNENNHVSGVLGVTMVARVKTLYSHWTSAQMWIKNNNGGRQSEGDPSWWLDPRIAAGPVWGGPGPIFPDQIAEYRNNNSLPPGPPTNRVTNPLLADQTAYHIIRVTNGVGKYGSRSLKIYFDEDPTPVMEFENLLDGDGYPPDDSGFDDGFAFGTFGGGSIAKFYYDWFTFTDTGMYAPGEEDDCIGSLIPNFCNRPFADADNDGDTDQDDFAKFQLCYSGNNVAHPDTPECRCFNQEGDDNDVDDTDFGEFQNCASGPNIPVNNVTHPSCIGAPNP
ncbi:MAG: COG1470 family protein [Planctomycetota bacterium]